MIVSIGVESFFAINTTIPRQTNKVIKTQNTFLKVGTETTSSLLLGKNNFYVSQFELIKSAINGDTTYGNKINCSLYKQDHCTGRKIRKNKR